MGEADTKVGSVALIRLDVVLVNHFIEAAQQLSKNRNRPV
jgi:hypothetical protein